VDRPETAGTDQRRQRRGGNVGDVGSARVDFFYAFSVDIEARDTKTSLGEDNSFW
jgi:hypothetical protein